MLLDDILDEDAGSFEKINLLTIDVEGNELGVLEGFSIKKYLPDIMVVEVKRFSIDAMQEYPVYRYLRDSGYQVRSVLFNSLIFERTTK